MAAIVPKKRKADGEANQKQNGRYDIEDLKTLLACMEEQQSPNSLAGYIQICKPQKAQQLKRISALAKELLVDKYSGCHPHRAELMFLKDAFLVSTNYLRTTILYGDLFRSIWARGKGEIKDYIPDLPDDDYRRLSDAFDSIECVLEQTLNTIGKNDVVKEIKGIEDE